jgi:hypothetical protein
MALVACQARGQGPSAQKSSARYFGLRIADFGFRIFLLFFSIRIPQSAIRNNEIISP